MDKVVLEVKNLSKQFKKYTAVKNVSFKLREKRILGFLGPNGAGKTTTIRMITGLLKSSCGEVFINGFSITKNYEEAMKSVGAIVETPHLYEYMSGKSNIEFFAKLCPNATKEHVDECIKISGLEHRLKDKVKTYSLGMKQRLGLAVAILNDPKFLILDEPTNGLDPLGIKELRELLKDLSHNKGLSILVSSHILTEMELLCDDISIILNGEIKYTNSMDNINKESSLEDVFMTVTKENSK